MSSSSEESPNKESTRIRVPQVDPAVLDCIGTAQQLKRKEELKMKNAKELEEQALKEKGFDWAPFIGFFGGVFFIFSGLFVFFKYLRSNPSE